MNDDIESLLVEVRAGTESFAQDLGRMRAEIDGTLTGGFARAGEALETGLASALKRGSLGFDDLKRVALSAFDDIARQGVAGLFGALGSGGGATGGAALNLGGLVTGLLGLPGRATGGNVAPGRGYLVGERGPEVFVPTSAGRVEANGSAAASGRNVNVAITLAAPRGASVPRALQRSSRQIASTVRRAIALDR